MSHQLQKDMKWAGLDKKTKNVAENIFSKKNVEFLKGDEASIFFSRVEKNENNEFLTSRVTTILKEYS